MTRQPRLFQTPTRIQRRRTKGWRMPENTLAVSRPGMFGNPWTVKKARAVGFTGTDANLARMCVGIFRNACARRLPAVAHILGNLTPLRGKNLACWCPLDQPCHADVLLELANA